MPRRLLALLTVATALAGATACGDGDDDQPAQTPADAEQPDQNVQSAETLPASDLERVIQAEDSVNTACRLTDDEAGSDMPLPEAIRILQTAFRTYPEGTYARPNDTQPRNMEKVVEQNAATLRKCGKTAEASKLASVLEEES